MGDPSLIGGLTALFFLMAVLYAAVGQGGGSGYLAAMALLGVAPENFRLIALTLNVVVASIGLAKFTRAGFFNGKLLLPFIASSVPLAFVGGYLSLPAEVFNPLVGVALLWAAVLLIWKPPLPDEELKGNPPVWASLLAGGGIGLLSGLIGIGGGIFLAPLLILEGMGFSQDHGLSFLGLHPGELLGSPGGCCPAHDGSPGLSSGVDGGGGIGGVGGVGARGQKTQSQNLALAPGSHTDCRRSQNCSVGLIEPKTLESRFLTTFGR